MSFGMRDFVYPALVIGLLIASPAIVLANSAPPPENGYKQKYTFTTNWFVHKIPAWTNVLKDLKGKPDIHYLEVGTFEGRSAIWTLENILTHPTARATIIDGFEEKNYKIFTSNLELSGEAGKVKILSGLSIEKIREVPLNSVDFAYIDGSGKGIVMLSDIVNTWNTLKVGGIMIISRYELNAYLRDALEMQTNEPGPIEAIAAFVKLYKPYIKTLASEENQVIVQKVRQ